jgi:hypothetical protein
MENKAEDEIRKRWEQEAKDKTEREEEAAQRPRKRPRAIGYAERIGAIENVAMVEDAHRPRFPAILDGIIDDVERDETLHGRSTRNTAAARTARGGAAKKTRRSAATRAGNSITELAENEDTVDLLD